MGGLGGEGGEGGSGGGGEGGGGAGGGGEGGGEGGGGTGGGEGGGGEGGGEGGVATSSAGCRRVRSRLASASSMVMAASVAQAWLTPVAWEEVALRAAHVRVRERVEMRDRVTQKGP